MIISNGINSARLKSLACLLVMHVSGRLPRARRERLKDFPCLLSSEATQTLTKSSAHFLFKCFIPRLKSFTGLSKRGKNRIRHTGRKKQHVARPVPKVVGLKVTRKEAPSLEAVLPPASNCSSFTSSCCVFICFIFVFLSKNKPDSVHWWKKSVLEGQCS